MSRGKEQAAQAGGEAEEQAAAEEQLDQEGAPEGESEEQLDQIEQAEARADSRLSEGGEGAAPEEEEPEDKPGKPPRPKKTSKERREERKAAERRVREERDYLLQQNAEILRRLAEVEGTALDSRAMTVDSRLSECLNDIAEAERLEFAAIEAKDSAGAIQARRIRDQAGLRANNLKAEKERLAQVLAQQKSRPVYQAPAPGAAEAQSHAAQFRADKTWLQFAQNGAPLNPASATALALDTALRQEGRLTDRDPAYWKELDRRLRAALPQMFGSTDEDEEGDEDPELEEVQITQQRSAGRPAQASQKGPRVGSSTRQQNAGTAYRLSPARVAAIKELGEWDDPKLKKQWIEYYQNWDREHGIS